ncbi:MAG: hypothetical protein WCO52_03680 [bacterium]
MSIQRFITSLMEEDTAPGEAVAREVKAGLAPVSSYLRRASAGMVVVLSSAIAWLGGVFCLLMALFFYLAKLDSFVVPAILTAGFSWLLGLIMVIIGFWLLRRPR